VYRNILVPTDASPLSAKAVEQAVSLAKSVGARITVLHVVPPLAELPAAEMTEAYDSLVGEGYILPSSIGAAVQERLAARSKATLEAACAKAAASGVACESIVATSSSPHEAIINQAEASGCDLILMASHGRKGVQAIVLGSETTKVLVHSKLPVLVVR
jgi:nucleotide-binding universal stress UspA family protein